MADSKPLNPDAPSSPSTSTLLHCGICSAVVNNPKVLPCLHTFCLKCLSSWADAAAEKDPSKYTKAISCPSCHEDFPLPEGGVKDLETNVIVDQLKQREMVQRRVDEDAHISCTSCEDGQQAVAHCPDCRDFLCESCVESHKRLRQFKAHSPSLLTEISKASVPKHGLCGKHREALNFYCETCEQPLCRDCMVIDHPSPIHRHTDFDTALQKRKANIEALYQESEDIPKAIDAALSEDEDLISALDANIKQVIELYKKTEQIAEGEFMQQIQEFQASKKLEIENHKQTLMNHKSRVCAALDMSRELMQKGADVDLGMMYTPLTKAMSTLGDLRPSSLHQCASEVDFVQNRGLNSGLGVLSGYRHWVMDKNTSSHIRVSGSVQPKSVAYCKSGDIAVANNTGNHKTDGDMCIIGDDGSVKKAFNTKVSADGYLSNFTRPYANPWGITVSQDGSIFVTDESTFIKVYDESGRLLRKFPTDVEYRGSHELRGLGSDSKGMLYIGHAAGYISISFENGGELLSFNTNDEVSANYIAVTPENHIIYSGSKVTGGQESSRVVLHKNNPNDRRSYVGREYTFYPPPSVDVAKFKPTGICVHEGHQVIFVANAGDAPGVYCYSLDGIYLGIVTKEVTSPQGIALRGDEQELAVCDGNGIKLFHPQ